MTRAFPTDLQFQSLRTCTSVCKRTWRAGHGACFGEPRRAAALEAKQTPRATLHGFESGDEVFAPGFCSEFTRCILSTFVRFCYTSLFATVDASVWKLRCRSRTACAEPGLISCSGICHIAHLSRDIYSVTNPIDTSCSPTPLQNSSLCFA